MISLVQVIDNYKDSASIQRGMNSQNWFVEWKSQAMTFDKTFI